MCPELDIPDRARLTNATTGNKYGDKVTYECTEGHELFMGDLDRTCGGTGQWSGEEPFCIGK